VRGSTDDVKLLNQRFENTLDIVQNIVIPETHDAVAESFKLFRAQAIFFDTGGMLAAVNLNDELRLGRDKVDYKARDRYLSLELVTREPPSAQTRPYQALGIRGISPKSSGTQIRHAVPPHPTLSPMGRGIRG